MKRFLAILAVPLAVLGFAACGDDDDDDGPTSRRHRSHRRHGRQRRHGSDDTGGITLPSLPDGTLPSLPGGTLPGGITVPSLPDISIPDISIPDVSLPDTESILRQVFPDLDDEQISCLSDALGDIGSDIDPSQVIDVLDDCNINISDITPGG